jgi:acyl-CoA synthetase (AMP-forming)/AMP-acid ligase II
MVDVRAVAPLAPSASPAGLFDGARSLIEALALLVEHCPDWEGMAILDRDGEERRVGLTQLWNRATAIASTLEASGMRRGDVVLLVLPTGPEIVAAYFGTMLAGGVPGLVATPSNRLGDPRVYAARVGAILRNAEARVVYCDPEIAALFDEHVDLLAGARLLRPGDVTHAASPHPSVPVDPEALATVQYSSGSTGTPKGILLTHRAMLANIRAVRDGLGLRSVDPSVNWIPLYHDMGLIDAFLLPLLNGCPTILIPTFDFMRDPSLWLWAVHRYRGALSWAPNFAYTLCATRVRDEDIVGLDLSSWRIAINAAESVLAPTLRSFTDRFAAYGFRPQAMTPAWGLAENVTIAAAHPTDEPPRVESIDRDAAASERLARPVDDGLPSVAVGRCLPGCAIEIRDAAGRVLPDRRIGDVWLRSDSLFVGYLRDAERTAQVLVDGWLKTGDQAYLADGDLYFFARDKDLIVIGGDKYAPHDIETAINRVPGVRQGCVIAFGVLSEERGTEEIAAVVETRAAAADRPPLEQSIRAAVLRETGLAVRYVLLVEPGGVEKTSSGKLARQATRRRWADALAAQKP